MSEKAAHIENLDAAIINALRRAREPLRYRELHKEADSILRHHIWPKTFNDHLQKLVEKSVVIREEKNRYHVTYELDEKHARAYAMDKMTRTLEAIRVLMNVPGGTDFFWEIVENAGRTLMRTEEESQSNEKMDP